MSKLLTVFGATGNQGGSVIAEVLAHPELSKTYKIRAVTRDTNKDSAKALAAKGIEVVAADLDDKASVEAAVKGSDAVFGVTNFWEKLSKDIEVAQGRTIADASKSAGVSHLIWSSLIHVSKTTKGANTAVHHFDSKAEVEEYIRSLNIPSTFFMPAVFMPTMKDSFRPSPQDPNVYAITLPFPVTTKIPQIAPAQDSGLWVAAALLQGPKNERIAAAGGQFSVQEMAEAYEAVTGRKTQAVGIPSEVFKGFLPEAVAEELVGNFKLIESPGYYAGEGEDAVERGHKLLEKYGLRKPLTWREYLEKTQ